MPNRDGTGPLGNGPIGAGLGRGRGVGRRINATSTKTCTCPKCGHQMNASRGIPCTEVECPKCGSKMKGPNCQ